MDRNQFTTYECVDCRKELRWERGLDFPTNYFSSCCGKEYTAIPTQFKLRVNKQELALGN